MNGKTESCLIAKLSHYVELNETAKGHLRELEKSTLALSSGDEVYAIGDPVTDLHVVKSGWVYAHTDLADGRRQIVKVYHPGDIVGFPDIGFECATVSLRAVGETSLCPFPKSGLNVIFRESPLLTALLFSLAIRDHAIFIDMMRVMGRMSAKERLSYLFLDLLSRQRITDSSDSDTLQIHLTQSEIGDFLGLTNVHVSKTLSAMERAGYITRKDRTIRIVRYDDMVDMCDFEDRYEMLDTSWFPASPEQH